MNKQEAIAAVAATDGGTEYTQQLSTDGLLIGSYLIGRLSMEITNCINRWLISLNGIDLYQLVGAAAKAERTPADEVTPQ